MVYLYKRILFSNKSNELLTRATIWTSLRNTELERKKQYIKGHMEEYLHCVTALLQNQSMDSVPCDDSNQNMVLPHGGRSGGEET